MRLLRVQVPDFKALKDVDISFEPDFYPQVFPLGSLNGGGKSTLLQLIFVLLHCFCDTRENWHLKKDIIARFLTELKIKDSAFTSDEVNNLTNIILLDNKGNRITLEYFYGGNSGIRNFQNTIDITKKINFSVSDNVSFLVVISSDIFEKYNDDTVGYMYEIQNAMEEIHKSIFLISPSNQPYLFLSREERRALFTANNQPQYDQAVKNAQATLPNFFTFDFVDILANVFNKAHSDDAIERTRTGCYGTHVDELEKAINELFIDGKKIVPLIQTTAMTESVKFRLPAGQEIYPEDLSDGELKRLTIFVLLKYKDIQDAIVLIDEIENGFHPDWQRHIVDDLVEWGASNQYILATHSYELCRGITAAHVKDLDPKLPY